MGHYVWYLPNRICVLSVRNLPMVTTTKLLQREVDKKNSRPYLIRKWKKYEIKADNAFEYFMFNIFPPLYGVSCLVIFVFIFFMMIEMYG